MTTGKKNRIVLKRNILEKLKIKDIPLSAIPLLQKGGVATSNDVKIQEKLALKPFYDGQEPRKSKDGKVMQFDGENVYSKSIFVNADEDDTIFLDGILQEDLYLTNLDSII